MLKRLIKYFLIIGINASLLSLLWVIWVDKFEAEFNTIMVFIELLKIIGVSILGLILFRVALRPIFHRFDINSIKKRILIASSLVLLISAFLYVDYGIKVYNNRFLNRELRDGIMEKVEIGSVMLAYGNRADSLTKIEYDEILKLNWFPDVPDDAKNISYSYQ